MSNQPLISVIIIFLNAGDTFFEEAIASVFAQTHEHWELLLVDDGSSDVSSQIAQRYADRYPGKVSYLEHDGHQNRGMSASRNLGIHHAQGDYIALLDADDIWLPEKLEKQLDILDAHPEAAIVYGSTRMWFSWTGNPDNEARDRQRYLGVQPDTLMQPPTLIPLFLDRTAETPGTCSVLMRRAIVEAVGGFEESFRGMFEDQAFFYKVCLQAPVFVESGCWDRYRQHAHNSCVIAQTQGNYNPFQLNSAEFNFLKWFEQYLTQQPNPPRSVQQALRTALFSYRHPYWSVWSKRIDQYRHHILRIVKSLARRILPTPVRLRLQNTFTP